MESGLLSDEMKHFLELDKLQPYNHFFLDLLFFHLSFEHIFDALVPTFNACLTPRIF